MTGDRTPRKLWSRADDTAYREAVAATRKPVDHAAVFADMRQEIEAAVRKALKRLGV